MNGATLAYYGTASGNIGGSIGGQIMSVTLTPAAAVATLVVSDSVGTKVTLQAAANGNSVQFQFYGLTYSGQLAVTLSGAGAAFMVEL